MQRLDTKFQHNWHAACNATNPIGDKPRASYMYEALTAADEVPRLARLFLLERLGGLSKTHRQCSLSPTQPIPDNHLTCCLGVKCRVCPALLGLEKMADVTPEQIDQAKAWTCVTHIISKGGDVMREGYVLTADDALFWKQTYESLASSEGEPE